MGTHYHDTDIAGEPTLDELFAEPIVRLIMQRDGVKDADLRRAIDHARDAYHSLEVVQ